MKKRIFTLLIALCTIAVLAAALAVTVFANPVTVGNFTVTGGEQDMDYKFENGVLTVLTPTALEIKNTDVNTATSHRIVVASGVSANITLAGVNISNDSASPFEIEANSKGNVTITLADGTINTLKSYGCAALRKEGSGDEIGTLTIQGGTLGTGKLIAESNMGAGIGGNKNGGAVSNITIIDGEVAVKSSSGAGIGSGFGDGTSNHTSNITISGGSVTATSNSGAGIGTGGSGWDSIGTTSNIVITGGSVTVTSTYSMGIGVGDGTSIIGATSNIAITGGSVKASSNAYGNVLGCTPTDGKGNNVYPYTLSFTGDDPSIQVNGVSYPAGHTYYDFGESKWTTEKNLYIYSPESLVTTISGASEAFAYSATSGKFESATIWLLDSTGNTVKGGYLDLQKAVDAAQSGDIVLPVENITVDKTVEIKTSLTLDLNGYMLKMTGTGSVLKVGDGTNATELTLVDSNLRGLSYKFKEDTNGLWVADDSGDKTVSGGVITGGNAENGGGVYISKSSSFTMSGGSIVGCKTSATYSSKGGGVYVSDGSSFTMKDGNIVGCTASSTFSVGDGGGVYVAKSDSFTMSGGTIMGCKADNGGGVSLSHTSSISSSFDMSGGTITGCKATYGGGVDSSGSFTLSGNAKITGCEATEGGGVNNSDSFTLSGNAKITGCEAETGTAIYSDSTMYAHGGTVEGDVKLYGNRGIIKHTASGGIESYTKFLGTIKIGTDCTVEDDAYPYEITLTNGKGRSVTVKLLRGQTLSASALLASDEIVLGWYYTEGETTSKVTLDTFLYDGTTERAPGAYTLTVDLVTDELDALETALAQLQVAYNGLETALADKADAATVTAAVEELQKVIDALEAVKNDYKGADEELEKRVTAAVESAKDAAIKAANDALEKAKDELNEAIGKKADATALTDAIDTLNKAIATAQKAAQDYADGKDETLNQAIANAENTLKGLIDDVQKNLDKAIVDLNKAISDGDTALDKKIADLNSALENARFVLETTDEADKAELEKKIASAQTALKAAIDKVASDLETAKSELEAKDAELEAKDAELGAKDDKQQIFITIVCVIACVSLAGNIAIVTTAFILKRKRTH